MNFFSSFASAFCAACVFIGALYMLCPDGAMQKSVKYIFVLVFILSVVSAAGIAAGRWEWEPVQYTAADTDTDAMLMASAEFVYSELLRSAGIDFSKITVCTDKTDSDSISISKVIICSDCESDRIMAALGDAAKNTEVEIVND